MPRSKEAGWTPARHHDLDDWVTSLRAEGFTIVAPALDVLRELGGLTITPPRRDDAAFGSGVVVIDPLWAATGEAERIRVRERELGSDLCPVGEWMGEYILLVADDGSLMGETTFQVLRVGRDIADALHRMIVADTPPEEVRDRRRRASGRLPGPLSRWASTRRRPMCRILTTLVVRGQPNRRKFSVGHRN